MAAVLVLGNLALALVTRNVGPIVGAAAAAGCVGLGLHASRRGKFVVWDELLDGLNLHGAERILDIGCGRGAVLMMAAQRLCAGRAVGVDLWNRHDQSGNAAAATLRNAQAEGVAQRVEIATGNMLALPFADDSFDLVVSSIAIHNVNGRPGRERAIDEAARVLRPGGRLVIADIFAARTYQARLMKLGMNEVACRSLGWRLWWGGPWVATRLVTATKPLQQN